MLKKIIFLILMSALILTLIGCRAKLEEKFAEKIFEEIGGDSFDIDGDTVTIMGENGEEFTFGSTEWPTSDLAKSIPEFKSGKVSTVMEMNDSLLIALEEVPKEDFEDYLDKIKQTFTEATYEMKSDGYVTYGAENGEGIGSMLTYSSDDETLSITVTQAIE